MKKLLVLLCVGILLTGCDADVDGHGEELTITNEQMQKISDDISSQVGKGYWGLNATNVSYSQGTIVTPENENYQSIYDASMDMGLDIKSVEGREAIIAKTKLSHFNGDEAGDAYFYFINDELVCEYYTYNGGIYSIQESNVYEMPNAFKTAEQQDVVREYSVEEFGSQFTQYNDINPSEKRIAVVCDFQLQIYSYENDFILVSAVDFASEGLKPMDVTYMSDGTMAVLLGQEEITETHNDTQDELGLNEDILCESQVPIKSRKVVFLDKDGGNRGQMELNLSAYTAISVNGNDMVLARDKSLDIYKYTDEGWSKKQQMTLKHWVNQLTAADMDNDGVEEYIMTDGVDIYIYRQEETLELLWRTYYSISTISNKIYVGDLNGDGSKEIYVEDNLGIMSRYVLGSRAVETYNGSIISEEKSKYIVGDFNGDGKDDYIQINSQDETGKVYIAK